jgi:hypothetical protein
VSKIFQIIKLRRNTEQKWEELNPILQAGEPGFELDTKRLKIGDGVTDWLSLAYASGVQSAATMLSQLDDISVDQPVENGEILIFDSQSSKWKNLTIVEAGIAAANHTHTAEELGVAAANHTHTAAELGVVSSSAGTMLSAPSTGTSVRNITVSTSNPSGGMDGDVWMVYS